MNMKKMVYLFCFSLFLISCSDKNTLSNISTINKKENSLTEQESKVLFRMREPNNRVSTDEVINLTNEIISILDGENALKSGSRRVSSTLALVFDNKPILRSSDSDNIEIPDTLAYILNFNDSLGFAIISADTRIDNSILAFTADGSLIDSTDNPGIALFLERLEDYILNSIVEAEHQKDSLLVGIMGKLGDESDTKISLIPTIRIKEIFPRQIVSQITPLVSVDWGQRAPFNNNLVNSKCDTGKNLAGCVAVAVAHIMSYWKYPTSINGNSFNWTELNQYTAASRVNTYTGAGSKSVSSAPDNVKIQLANLFQHIGKGVNMNYGCDGSGASTSNSVTFLSKQGFKTGGLKGYDSSTVVKSLNNNQPLMATGCSKATTTITKFLGIQINKSTSYSNCHQWVIDGYLKQKITLNITIEERSTGKIVSQTTSYSYSDYIHNNWGWNGTSNGYFPIGVFNSNDVPISSGTKSSEDYNYQYRIEIVPNIYR